MCRMVARIICIVPYMRVFRVYILNVPCRLCKGRSGNVRAERRSLFLSVSESMRDCMCMCMCVCVCVSACKVRPYIGL